MIERRRSALARLSFTVATIVSCGGCSILLHSDPSQCSSTSDCLARGAAFANHTCQAGTCVLASIGASDAGDAGDDAEVSGDASITDTGATDTGPDTAAEAGSELEASVRCTSNADCVATSQTHPEVACDIGSGACLQLTSDECPFVIGDISGKLATPIFLGAFAHLPPNAPQSDPSFLNYTLALKEFGSAGGIPGWDPARKTAGLRMPAAVICNDTADVHLAMTHLQADLHVPVIVTALDSVTLRTTFVNEAYPNSTLIVNPFGADSTLTSLTTDGLLWHMLGQPRDNAPAYAGFFPRMESYIRSSQNLGTTPIRIATITANATVTQDLAGAALSVMRWNDGSTVDQNTAQALFKNVNLESVLNGKPLGEIDVSAAVTALLDFKPNVIVSFAATEFSKLLQVLEIQWTESASNPRPFYLLGPYNMVSRDVLSWIGTGSAWTGSGAISPSEAKRMRVAGIGVASAADAHVLNAYSSRFLGTFLDGAGALGQENYYDAMYFAVYSIVGAGKLSTLGGANAAQGMVRLLSGTSYDMGPSDMGSIFGALGSPTSTLSLFGTLGPPNFTRSTGARIGEGSIYCVKRNDVSAAYSYDVLRMAPGDAGSPSLGGRFSCYNGL